MKYAIIRLSDNVVITPAVQDTPPAVSAGFVAREVPGNVYFEPNWIWQGGDVYAKPAPLPEVTNKATIVQRAQQALIDNRTMVAQITNWRTTAPGAGTGTLTTAQLSPVVRQIVDDLIPLFNQMNAVIRTMLEDYSGTD